jgi:hypothetical protein
MFKSKHSYLNFQRPMAYFQQSDLQYQYTWSANGGDDPKLRGEPDASLLDRTQGHEVLYMIRKLMEAWWGDSATITLGKKIEKMIKLHPSDIRSQEKVKKWILDNWKNF